MKQINAFINNYFIVFALITICSCKKFVEVKLPSTALTAGSVYTNNSTAAGVLTGIYTEMSKGNFTGGSRGISMIAGLSGDELTLYSGSTDPTLIAIHRNNLNNQNVIGPWKNSYTNLNSVNTFLEGLTSATTLTYDVKKQLEGEAKFLRAFYYFYLVNFYGEVPMVVTSDWRVNATISRASKEKIWEQIIKDLTEAKELLSDEFKNADALTSYPLGFEERVRPTRWAAIALLARAYLYLEDFPNAELMASLIINSSSNFKLESDINTVFLKTSKEAIWQLMPVNTGWNTEDARVFVLTGAPTSLRPVYLSSFLLNAFEPGDKRTTKGNWVNSLTSSGITYYWPNKYKIRVSGQPITEYLMVLRLAEQYLIRAEARIQQNKILEGIEDINLIRDRARGLPTPSNPNPLPSLSGTLSKEQALTAVAHERQIELFTEWGHRWLDLKRTEKIENVMSVVTPIKANGGAWNSYQKMYPLYIGDIQLNPNLSPNNLGY